MIDDLEIDVIGTQKTIDKLLKCDIKKFPAFVKDPLTKHLYRLILIHGNDKLLKYKEVDLTKLDKDGKLLLLDDCNKLLGIEYVIEQNRIP